MFGHSLQHEMDYSGFKIDWLGHMPLHSLNYERSGVEYDGLAGTVSSTLFH